MYINGLISHLLNFETIEMYFASITDGSGFDTVDADSKGVPSSAAALLSQGAACNVLYLNTIDMESLTG